MMMKLHGPSLAAIRTINKRVYSLVDHVAEIGLSQPDFHFIKQIVNRLDKTHQVFSGCLTG
jgi:hypothetical protein